MAVMTKHVPFERMGKHQSLWFGLGTRWPLSSGGGGTGMIEEWREGLSLEPRDGRAIPGRVRRAAWRRRGGRQGCLRWTNRCYEDEMLSRGEDGT